MFTHITQSLHSLTNLQSVFRAGMSVLLQVLGLGSQLALRILMTAALGASAAYDAWILALLVGGMVAQLGSQTMSSALLPLVSDLVAAGRYSDARGFFNRAVRVAFFGSLILALLSALVALPFTQRYGSSFPFLLLLVVLAWGSFGGVYILRRQALNFLRQPLRGQAVGLLPMAGMLVCAASGYGSDTLGLASAALGGFVMAALISGYWLSRTWVSEGQQTANTADIPLRSLGTAMVPIIFASLNSQGLSLFEQSLAATWMPGGVALFGTALALGRLPNMLADAAIINVGYGRMLRAVSACRIAPSETSRTRVGEAFQMLLRIQTFLIFPAAIFLALFAHNTVSVLFERGKFMPQDVEQTAAILSVIPFAAMGLMLQSVNVQMLVAWGRPGLALRYEVIAAVLTASMDIVMLSLVGLPGIPVGGAIAISVTALLTFRELARLTRAVTWTDLLAVWARPAVAAGISSLVGLLVGKFLLVDLPTGFGGLPRLMLVGITQTLVFFSLAVPRTTFARLRKLRKS